MFAQIVIYVIQSEIHSYVIEKKMHRSFMSEITLELWECRPGVIGSASRCNRGREGVAKAESVTPQILVKKYCLKILLSNLYLKYVSLILIVTSR